MATPAELTTRLAEAEAALHALLTGQQTVSVGYDGKSVTYTKTSMGALRAYIAELNKALGNSTGRTRPIGIVF